MGYTTDFFGSFNLNKKLNEELRATLVKFSETRHETNESPTVPGYYCQWIPTPDGLCIEWDGDEKFYHYVEWLQYLCDYYFTPHGYTLNGSVRYQGEDSGDAGWVVCVNNRVSLSEGMLVPRVPEQSGIGTREVDEVLPVVKKKLSQKFKAVGKRTINWE